MRNMTNEFDLDVRLHVLTAEPELDMPVAPTLRRTCEETCARTCEATCASTCGNTCPQGCEPPMTRRGCPATV